MPAVEYVTLANHAEAINGLLYLQGAGWNVLNRQVAPGEQPPAVHFGIGASLLVSWAETNRRHDFAVWIEPEDGGSAVFSLNGGFEVGRAPGVRSGADQRTVLAMQVTLGNAVAGGYRLMTRVGAGDGASLKSVSLEVRDQLALGLVS